MGTRSLTFVYSEDETKLTARVICMYRQMDGYPSGHGKDLAEFLASSDMVNGLGSDSENVFNGVSCMAAQMVAHFKDGPGSIYLHPTNTKDARQDYEYHIYFIDGKFRIRVVGEKFDSTLEAFTAWCVAERN